MSRSSILFIALGYFIALNPCAAAPLRPTSNGPGVNVLEFGAVPNDLFDDTKAIQAAIDSLPKAAALDVAATSGGVVNIPRGVYHVTTLRLPSAVTLRGEGAGSVLIGEAASPTVLICSSVPSQQPLSFGVDSLAIVAGKGSAIGVDPSAKAIGGGIFDRLFLKAHRTAIDLHGTYSQDMLIRDTIVWNGGGAALWLEGNANEVSRLNTERSDDADFTLGDGVAARVNIIGNGNTITGCIIESGSKSAPAFYCRGMISWTNNWVETFEQPGDVAYLFDQCSGQIDNLHLLEANHKAKFMNSHGLQIRQLQITTEEEAPASCVIVDDASSITVDEAITRYDCGWLDHPNFRIKSYYNSIGKYLLENPSAPNAAANLLRDPDMKTAAAAATGGEGDSGWRAWADGGATYSLTPELFNGKPSLRIDLTKAGEKNVCVAAKLSVPAELVGKRGILQVQMDGPSHMLVWSTGFAGQYAIRHWGERVMALSPAPLTKDEEVIFVIDAHVPGTYRLSGLSVMGQ